MTPRQLLVTLLLAAPSLLHADTLPKPIISTNLQDGVAKIAGRIPGSPAGTAVRIQYFVDNTEDTSAQIFVNVVMGDFTIQPTDPLKGGQTIKITYKIDSNAGVDFVQAIPAPVVKHPKAYFAEVAAGSDEIKVYFEPDKNAKAGSIKILRGTVTLTS